jgi:hypothetical protein
MGYKDAGWNHVARDRVQQHAFVYTEMNRPGPK